MGKGIRVTIAAMLFISSLGSMAPAQVPDVQPQGDLTVATWELDKSDNLTLSDVIVVNGVARLAGLLSARNQTANEFQAGTFDNATLGPQGVVLSQRSDWWDEDYRYRYPVTVHNIDGTVREANFTVDVTLDTATMVGQGMVQEDLDDLRVVFDNGTALVEIDRLVFGNNTASTRVMFRTQEVIPASTALTGRFFFYFGNSTVTDPPDDPRSVYFFYDDFREDTVENYTQVNNLRTQTGGPATINYNATKEWVNLSSGNSNNGMNLLPKNTSAPNIHVEAEMNMAQAYTAGPRDGNFQMCLRFLDIDNYYMMTFSVNNWDPSIYKWVNAIPPTIAQPNASDPGKRVDPDTHYTFWMSALNDTIEGGVDGATNLSFTDPAPSLGNGTFGAGIVAGDGYLDALRAWLIAAQMPVLTLGDLEGIMSPLGTFTSEPLDAVSSAVWTRVNWTRQAPVGTDVMLKARTSDNGVNWTLWSADLTNGSGVDLQNMMGQYIQFMATLSSDDLTNTPVLSFVQFNYSKFLASGRFETRDLEEPELISWDGFAREEAIPNVTGCGIVWELSINSGSSWSPVPANGNLSGIPTASKKLRFRATITTGNTTMSPTVQLFNVTYLVNKSPVLVTELLPVSFPEDTVMVGAYNLTQHFDDNEDMTFTGLSNDTNLTVTVHANGTVDLEPVANWTGEANVTFKAEDEHGAVTQAHAKVTVTPVNDPPVILSEPVLTVMVGHNYSYQLDVADVDGDIPEFELIDGPTNMSMNSTGLVKWRADSDHIGANAVSIKVSDGLAHAWQNYTLVVDRPGGNQLPVITSEPIPKAYVGLVYKYSMVATDADGDRLSFGLVQGPEYMSVDQLTGLVTWTPEETELGNNNVILKVSDPFGSVEQEFVIEVLPAGSNTRPTIAQIPDIKVKGDPVVITLSDYVTDPDEPVTGLIWRIENSTADLFLAQIIGQDLRITPLEGERGEGTLTLVVRDSGGLEDSILVNVVVVKKDVAEPGLWDALLANCLLFVAFLIVLIVVVLFMFLRFMGRETGPMHVEHKGPTAPVSRPTHAVEPTKKVDVKAEEEEEEEEEDILEEEEAEIEKATVCMERIFNNLIRNKLIDDDELDATLKGAAKKEQAMILAALNEYDEVVLEPTIGFSLKEVAEAYSRVLDMALRPSLLKDDTGDRRKKVIEIASGVLDGELSHGAMIIGRTILGGALSERLQTGVPGLDDLLGGGLPKGSTILVQMPMGAEKDLLMMQLAAAGMTGGQGTVVTLSDSSPTDFYKRFERVGVNPEVYGDKDALRVVDWNTYKTKRVRDVEEEGAVIRSSKGITNLGIALTDAGRGLSDQLVKRAVVDVVSSAVKIFGMDTGYRFIQTVVARLKEMGFTSVFIVDKDMHEDEELGTISQTFDGVIDIERTREGKRIVTEIMVLSLSKPGFSNDVKIMEITEKGLVIKDE